MRKAIVLMSVLLAGCYPETRVVRKVGMVIDTTYVVLGDSGFRYSFQTAIPPVVGDTITSDLWRKR